MRARIAALFVAAALCSCGSGSGSPSPVTPAQSSLTRTQAGTASLVLKFPPNFHTAKKNATAGARRPSYVNPSGTAVIAITVDETAIPGSPIAVTNTNGDGTQTLTVPIYSGFYNNVVAIEYEDSSLNQILAIGEADNNYVSSGGSTSITLQMQMNVAGIAFSTSSSGTGAIFLNSESTVNVGNYCSTPTPPSQNGFYIWSADATGGFVAQAGYGGVPTPTLTNLSPNGSTYTTIAPGAGSLQSGYFVTYDPNGDTISPYVTDTNPAYTIQQSTLTSSATYPSIYNLVHYDGLSLTSITNVTSGFAFTVAPSNGC